MRRDRIVAGTAVAAFLVGVVLAWPLIETAAARALERRLQAQTGRPWTIGSLNLSLLPKPAIVARDISVGGAESVDGVGKIRQLRLADALALVGSGGRLHVEAEGLSLRLPTSAPAAKPDAATATLPKVASLQATLRGASAELADAGKALIAQADSAQITLDPAEDAPRTEVKVRLESAAYTAEIAYTREAAQQAGPLTVTLDPRAERGHRASAATTAAFAPDAIRLDAMAGTIDGASFAGNLALGLGGPKPELGLDLRLDALTLTGEATAEPQVRVQDGGVVVSVPPDLVPDVRWFEGFEGKGSLSIARLHVGHADIADAAIVGTVKAGSLDAALSSAALYSGQARGRYVLSPENGTGRHQLGLSLNKLKALPMLSDLAAVHGIDGTGSARLDLQARGDRLPDLLRTLSGRADLAVTDGHVDGLDLAGALGLLPRRGGDPGPGSLATRLDRLAGSFAVSDGQAVTDDVVLKTGLIEATGQGRIDIPGRTLDLRFKPQVASTGVGRAKPRVEVPVRVAGPWTDPSVSADLSGLADNPGAAIQSLQDLGTNLLDRNKGGGDVLDGLGEALGDLLGGGGGGGRNGGNLGDLLDSVIPKPETGTPGRRGRPTEPRHAPR